MFVHTMQLVSNRLLLLNMFQPNIQPFSADAVGVFIQMAV